MRRTYILDRRVYHARIDQRHHRYDVVLAGSVDEALDAVGVLLEHGVLLLLRFGFEDSFVGERQSNHDVARIRRQQISNLGIGRSLRREPGRHGNRGVATARLVHDFPSARSEHLAQHPCVAFLAEFVTRAVGDRRAEDGDAAGPASLGLALNLDEAERRREERERSRISRLNGNASHHSLSRTKSCAHVNVTVFSKLSWAPNLTMRAARISVGCSQDAPYRVLSDRIGLALSALKMSNMPVHGVARR